MITVHRQSAYADSLRPYQIVIDENVVGKVKSGKTVIVAAPSVGTHQIWVTIDWCRSEKLEFNYTNSDLRFECSSNLKGARVFLLPLYFFIPTKWCSIRQV